MKNLYDFCEEFYSLGSLDQLTRSPQGRDKIIADYYSFCTGTATKEEVEKLFIKLHFEFLQDLAEFCKRNYPRLPHKANEIAILAEEYRKETGCCRFINFSTLEKLK